MVGQSNLRLRVSNFQFLADISWQKKQFPNIPPGLQLNIVMLYFEMFISFATWQRQN
jgi:hypothetical protein